MTLDAEQCEKFSRFYSLVKDWNTKINLISRRDIDNLLANHILDSLAALPVLLNYPEDAKGMDLGPGGGFPGVPLKICLPKLKLTCIEATQKKARFIELVVSELGLADVVVIAKHSKEIQRERELLNGFDFITARAVAEIADLVKMTFPFLKTGGNLIAYKSGKTEEELRAAKDVMNRCGGRFKEEIRQDQNLSNKDRRIIVIRKIK